MQKIIKCAECSKNITYALDKKQVQLDGDKEPQWLCYACYKQTKVNNETTSNKS